MTELTQNVKDEIRAHIEANYSDWLMEAEELAEEENEFQLTYSCNAEGTEWAYQTGDNSYSGACYFHPFWGVTYIHRDCDQLDNYGDVVEQLEEQLAGY